VKGGQEERGLFGGLGSFLGTIAFLDRLVSNDSILDGDSDGVYYHIP
jgi:hypothetical protein